MLNTSDKMWIFKIRCQKTKTQKAQIVCHLCCYLFLSTWPLVVFHSCFVPIYPGVHLAKVHVPVNYVLWLPDRGLKAEIGNKKIKIKNCQIWQKEIGKARKRDFGVCCACAVFFRNKVDLGSWVDICFGSDIYSWLIRELEPVCMIVTYVIHKQKVLF